MYIVLGNEIVDSEEIKVTIEDNSDFRVEKDLSKGTKREDVVAYQLSIDVETLNDYLKEDYDIDTMDSEELFDEYMTISDEAAMELEEVMPEDTIANARSYKWDNSENAIKVVIAIANEELGELKLSDITKRLLSQVD
ncbi:hypothetical protein CHL78_020155 [Romboutsia weinsteinii]|uniref:Uncharacterized protein n=1 Tax=Romboutsia weinsteinii TaxID=2020949 RepID=A0A371IX68_9FIRM|nr:hypothetical protein [Romboutsia weinsteinii]RDY25073.1 hypothetical protein CHL78_020155 [Romboutsia weinsteinii]